MMANKISNSERIARNTMLLYIRMLFVMGVTLFTSRIILQALGVVDFGIYNVVGGLSGAFVFFSSALSSSTQRYLNVFLGRNEMDKVQKVFNLSLLIYSGIALIMVLTGLIIGNWYNPQIQISAESETKRSIFREKDKTKRSKKESAQHSKSRNKSFVMTSVSAL